MKILDLTNKKQSEQLLNLSDINREVRIYHFQNITFLKNKTFYPECIISENDKYYDIIDEKIMSLDLVSREYTDLTISKIEKEVTDNVFFFVYNTENYYHFVYDTLPYLLSYFELKQKLGNIKLLMNYPNRSKNKMFPFVKEFLGSYGIKDDDILFVNDTSKYINLYVSSSFTHGIDSNLPMNNSSLQIYRQLKVEPKIDTPKKIYVSRRSWKHNNFTNIGTNYTQRRKMKSEDLVVDFLEENGFTEVFPEILSHEEKINLFKNATHIVGMIGGGLVNCLFSDNAKLFVISSPLFLDINKRFVHSFVKVDTTIFDDTFHIENHKFKKYMRVKSKSKNIIGEIDNVKDNTVSVIYSDHTLAGWDQSSDYKTIDLEMDDCEILDLGLNSEFDLNLENFKLQIINFLS